MKPENLPRRRTLAKFTPPGVAACLPRERLFLQIDAVRQQSGLWIAGPGGSGKTVLLASYLASRQLPYLWMRLDSGDSDAATFFHYLRLAAEKLVEDASQLPAPFAPENTPSLDHFSRGFFRELYQAVPPGSVFVFDNSHEQMLTEQAIELIKTAITEAPREITVIVASRINPPATLSGARVSGELALLGWSELSFQADELRQLAGLQQGEAAEERLIEQAIAQSRGWAAGFLLMMQKKGLPGSTPETIETASEQALFDYFASEIFCDLQSGEREFLLKTAFLPILTAELAAQLTRSEESGARLNHLVRANYFTVAHQGVENSFEYHPLFRQFLLAQAQHDLSKAQIAALQRDAARVLAAAGHAEAAVPLLIEAGEWEALAEAIIAQAPELLAQGRHQRLLSWLTAIPAADNPWLVYWEGIARMPLDTESSYRLLGRAYGQFAANGDLTGTCLAWAGAVESLVHTLADLARMDTWLAELETILAALPADGAVELKAILAPQIVAIAALRGPSGIDIEPWLALTQSLLLQPIDPTQRITASFVLVSYYNWLGETGRAEQLLSLQEQILKEEGVRPLARLTAKLSIAWYAWISGEQARCRQAMERGLAIAEASGVHHWDFILRIQGITNALLHGNSREARDYLEQLEPLLTLARDFDRAYYHNERGWLEMLEGRPEKALLQQQLALELAESVGAPYPQAEASYGLSQALHAIGDTEQASHYLAQAQQLAEQYQGHTLAFQCGLLQAWYQYARGEADSAAATLQQTYAHAKQHGYSGFAWWLQEQLAELCAFSLARDIEPTFVRNLIRRFDLPPPQGGYLPSRWPWPVRIETLGAFAITIDGQPLQVSGKGQLRPLDLIKALIALGGQHVSTERLAETLWPDAEGDAANRNLQTTIHRLRKLLQHDRAILVQQGMISLNPAMVWVDVLALEARLKGLSRAQVGRLPALAEEILGIYRGEFLERESEEGWILTVRERLRGSMIKGLQRLAERLRANGEAALARRLDELALTIDPAAEESGRRLMSYHALAGNKAEALALYHRLSETLQQQFNATPSALTRKLAEAIAADDEQGIARIVSGSQVCI